MKLNLPKQKTFSGPAILWKRVLAFLLDMLIINFVILLPFKSLFKKMIPASLSFKETFDYVSNPELSSFIMAISIFTSLLSILYFMILEGKFGQSIGKILLKIYVVSDQEKLKFWQLLVRNLFLIPLFPFFLLWVIDPIFMIFMKDKKRLSELLSKTKVIETYQY